MNKQTIDQIFHRFSCFNPSPETELKYTNNYTLVVAVMLSAQSTDIAVNKATESLFKLADTPLKMIQLGEEKIKNYIKTIGLYNNKCKNILKTSQILVDKYKSSVPSDLNTLMSLPGIGMKTAKVILNSAFGESVVAVDTHVLRTSKRIGLSDKNSFDKVSKDLEKRIPKKWLYNAHHWLVLHGRYVCKAHKPMCNQCIISDVCDFFKRENN